MSYDNDYSVEKHWYTASLKDNILYRKSSISYEVVHLKLMKTLLTKII